MDKIPVRMSFMTLGKFHFNFHFNTRISYISYRNSLNAGTHNATKANILVPHTIPRHASYPPLQPRSSLFFLSLSPSTSLVLFSAHTRRCCSDGTDMRSSSQLSHRCWQSSNKWTKGTKHENQGKRESRKSERKSCTCNGDATSHVLMTFEC